MEGKKSHWACGIKWSNRQEAKEVYSRFRKAEKGQRRVNARSSRIGISIFAKVSGRNGEYEQAKKERDNFKKEQQARYVMAMIPHWTKGAWSWAEAIYECWLKVSTPEEAAINAKREFLRDLESRVVSRHHTREARLLVDKEYAFYCEHCERRLESFVSKRV